LALAVLQFIDVTSSALHGPINIIFASLLINLIYQLLKT